MLFFFIKVADKSTDPARSLNIWLFLIILKPTYLVAIVVAASSELLIDSTLKERSTLSGSLLCIF